MANHHWKAILSTLTAASMAACVAPGADTAPVNVESAHAALTGENGLRLNGLRLNGLRLNGLRLNGLRLNGLRLNGLRLNGLRLNGLRLNGLDVDGLSFADATNVHGLTLNGLSLGGVTFHSTTYDSKPLARDINTLPLQGESYDMYYETYIIKHDLRQATDDTGEELDAATQDTLVALLDPLVACVANPGVTVQVETHSGTVTLPRLPRDPADNQALDPGFITTGPDSSVSSAVADCVIAADSAITYEPLLEQAFDTYARYYASCLADQNDQIAIEQPDGSMKHYQGGLGLAPWVKDQALDPAPAEVASVHGADVGVRRLSACLAARVNVLGEHVLLSFRGTTINNGGGIALDSGEDAGYPVREGAFWGNMFGDKPAIYTCIGEGRSLSEGRLCARDESACGFQVKSTCPDQYKPDAQNPSNGCAGIRAGAALASCGLYSNEQSTFPDAGTETEVLTTYIVRGNCGNGTREDEEECDDGNDANGDGCSIGCKTEVCGDGRVNQAPGVEQCDDGNNVNGDGCHTLCIIENVCGNTLQEDSNGESCDDGNLINGDGCDDRCQYEGGGY